VTGCSATPRLVRVDARLNQVRTTARLDGLGPTLHAGQLWIGALGAAGTTLLRAHPDRLHATTPVPVPGLEGVAGIVALDNPSGSAMRGRQSSTAWTRDLGRYGRPSPPQSSRERAT
jgi:hypothetical protein